MPLTKGLGVLGLSGRSNLVPVIVLVIVLVIVPVIVPVIVLVIVRPRWTSLSDIEAYKRPAL